MVQSKEVQAVLDAQSERRRLAPSECGVPGHIWGDMDEAWYCTRCNVLVPAEGALGELTADRDVLMDERDALRDAIRRYFRRRYSQLDPELSFYDSAAVAAALDNE